MTPPKFATEAALCAAFIDAIESPKGPPWSRKKGEALWRAYPETECWDILLVRIADGCQIGIEAKLALNAKVLDQALPRYAYWSAGETGPDFRAVLVPEGKTGGLSKVCAYLGVTVLTLRTPIANGWTPPVHPDLPRLGYDYSEDSWHDWIPVKRCPVPDYVPDVAAGASAPVALTPWKVKAIKLAVLLEERPITRGDFKALQLSPSRWTEPGSGWLQKHPTLRAYVPGPRFPNFKDQHPRNYDEIKADKAKWAPPVPVFPEPFRQDALL